jgi:hypothetical protein
MTDEQVEAILGPPGNFTGWPRVPGEDDPIFTREGITSGSHTLRVWEDESGFLKVVSSFHRVAYFKFNDVVIPRYMRVEYWFTNLFSQ